MCLEGIKASWKSNLPLASVISSPRSGLCVSLKGERAADELSAMMSKNLRLSGGGGGAAAAATGWADRARTEAEQLEERVQELEAQLRRQQGLVASLGPSLADGGNKVGRRYIGRCFASVSEASQTERRFLWFRCVYITSGSFLLGAEYENR